MTRSFYSNGKLLLSGEYLVLDGALALAIPTTRGQSLEVVPNQTKLLQWESIDADGNSWMKAEFGLEDLEPRSKGEVEETLSDILKAARDLNPDFLNSSQGWKVTSRLDFPRDWGLGSSSTLINNIAQWAEADAFQILEKTFGGSGYDIAAAQYDIPICYRRQTSAVEVIECKLDWPFKEKIFFVHLGQKMDSRKAIAHYRTTSVVEEQIEAMDRLTRAMVTCENLNEFELLIGLHEEFMSDILDIEPVQQRLFPDYPGKVKSLGAWGGDFVMVTGTKEQQSYFAHKGYNTIIPFEKMIK